MPHWLEVVFVAIHVLAATVWAGETVALTFIAVPAIRRLTGEPRQVAMRTLGQRWVARRPHERALLLSMELNFIALWALFKYYLKWDRALAPPGAGTHCGYTSRCVPSSRSAFRNSGS